MRILVASDIHGRVNAITKFSKIIDSYNPDKIFLLGDYLYNGPRNGVKDDYEPMVTSQIINKYASKIIGVRGNCDSRIDEDLLEFSIEDGRVETIGNRNYCLFHGDRNLSDILNPKKGDILIYGHTHIAKLEKINDTIYLNPGSIGFPKGEKPASFAIIEDDKIEIRSLDKNQVLDSILL